MTYKHNRHGGVILDRDDRSLNIPEDPSNGDWQAYLAWLEEEPEEGEPPHEALPADPAPEPELTRDELLDQAVNDAKVKIASAVEAKVFTAKQAAALESLFEGFGAITQAKKFS